MSCFSLLLLVSLTPQISAQQQTSLQRVLPLNRFQPELSVTDHDAFHVMATAVGDDYFDGTSPPERVRRHFAVAREAGVKYLRCAFSWDAIEKTKGQYDWKFWDLLVDLAQQNGIHLIPYVAYTPEWAARDSKLFWKQPPRDPHLYSEFMYTIASRYRGRIHSWEIWNEPDNKDFWLGTADEYAELVELAARGIRDADPSAILVLGGMAYGPQEFFQHLMSKYHIDRYVDVIAMHAYPESWMNERAETVFLQWVPAMHKLIDANRSGDALWVNEMGYPDYRLSPNQASIYGVPVFYNYEHTRQYEAAMLFKFYVMAFASGEVSLTGWYRIDDFAPGNEKLGSDLVNYHLGLVDASGNPKPTLFALHFFNQLFGPGAILIHPRETLLPRSQSIVYALRTRQDRLLLIGWLRSPKDAEVANKSGQLQDNRLERVSIDLPCSGQQTVSNFDPEGDTQTPPLQNNSPAQIELRGDRVYIAEVSCSLNPTQLNR